LALLLPTVSNPSPAALMTPATPKASAQPSPPSADDRSPVAVPSSGSGRFVIAPAPDNAASAGAFTYTVEVEDTLTYEPAQIASTVDRTLTDGRGWSAATATTFQRVADAAPTRVLLATPDTVDRLCAPLRTNGQVSCRNGDLVVLNALRWSNGSPAYDDDIGGYRQYLINHEVGHRLGRDHQSCPRAGAPAPVMLQQTKGLQGCEKNPWP
jgi:hypothetical protein